MPSVLFDMSLGYRASSLISPGRQRHAWPHIKNEQIVPLKELQ